MAPVGAADSLSTAGWTLSLVGSLDEREKGEVRLLSVRRIALLSVLLGSTLLVSIGPARAVVGGTADTGNTFSSVGLLEVQFEPGEWFGICSGTLIREDVVLTAAQSNLVLWLPLAVLPGAVLLCGILVVANRRRLK